ncbi:MAG: hypothetical protein OEZ35_00210 [Candidatus Bathyarchaeota archaeon]|nr:hypothetical protein [Candidatus Bathyarchaeota archaeon]
MKMISSAEKRRLEPSGMLKKELFSSLLFAVETLRKLLSSAVKCVAKPSTLTASHYMVFNIVNSIRVESF